MGISKTISYAGVDDLNLDPLNPRLGRHRVDESTPQEKLLEWMADWTIDELALSYIENQGYWTHEAMLVTKEHLYGREALVVVEGNRRLAALKYLRDAYNGRPASRKWQEIANSGPQPPDLFDKVPYIPCDSRRDVEAFLGFRHVTGIKQWEADEKAGFIAKLIEEHGLSYDQVRRRVGSKTPTVRQHYIAYRLLRQIEEMVDEFEPQFAENRFAILYMSLRTEGVRHYLQVDSLAEPPAARIPVPRERLQHLARFALWLFGTDKRPRLVSDTRQVDEFGKILESVDAVAYLESDSAPRFDVALRIAGGDEEEILQSVEEASHRVEVALTRAHVFRDIPRLQKAVRRLGADVMQLLTIFPKIREELTKEAE